MRSISTLARNIADMKEMMVEPKWSIGFKYFFLDDRYSINLDILLLIKHYGFNKEYKLCSSYYAKHPNSIGMPMSQGVDNFFSHLQEIGIFKKDTLVGSLEQTPETRAIYVKILNEY